MGPLLSLCSRLEAVTTISLSHALSGAGKSARATPIDAPLLKRMAAADIAFVRELIRIP